MSTEQPDHSVDWDDVAAQPEQDWSCSTIRSAQDTATTTASFRAVLADIASPKYAAQVEAVRTAYAKGGKDAAADPKKKLPGVLFSGTFSRRAASALVKHSGLICADLDELGDGIEGIFETVVADPHTLACFRSPTGTGLKVIFRVDPAKPHIDSFHATELYVLEHFGLQIDQACKDVCRICFVSHDPEAFVGANAVPLPYPPPAKEFAPEGLNPRSGLEMTPGDDYDNRGDFAALLTAHGWSKCPGGWTRPGKTTGLSATFDRVPGRFYIFSSSVPGFEPNHVYRPWHVYAILEHGGDFRSAARKLGAEGYGTQPKTKTRQEMNLERIAGPEPEQEKTAKQTITAKPLFTLPLGDDNDPSILLGNRYLSRGDGAVLSSSSGMGKSAMAIQLSALFSLGRPFFGIKPRGEMRILYVQSEDSEGDMAEVAESMRHGLDLTASDIAKLNANLLVVTDRVNRGNRFIASLKAHIATHKPDLVILNPLQAFIDGDITASQDLGAFLREGLNALNEPATFAYLLIHHTTKPATGKERSERLWHEVMYDMAGGAEIINWARAILSLRATPAEGEFNLVLAKRGKRAGATKTVPHGMGTREEPTTVIPLKHSTERLPSGQPMIFWEARSTEDAKADKLPSGGRPSTHSFDDYRAVFPPKDGPGLPLAELHRRLIQQRPINKDALFRALKRWARDGEVEIVPVPNRSDNYRAAV